MRNWMDESVERVLVGRRAHRRSRLRMFSHVRGDGSTWEFATLIEISVAGIRLEALPASIRRNSFWLRIGRFNPMPAKVLWKCAEEVGCQFLFPLSQDTFEQIIRYSHGIEVHLPVSRETLGDLGGPFSRQPVADSAS